MNLFLAPRRRVASRLGGKQKLAAPSKFECHCLLGFCPSQYKHDAPASECCELTVQSSILHSLARRACIFYLVCLGAKSSTTALSPKHFSHGFTRMKHGLLGNDSLTAIKGNTQAFENPCSIRENPWLFSSLSVGLRAVVLAFKAGHAGFPAFCKAPLDTSWLCA